jgi:hypothetical protein
MGDQTAGQWGLADDESSDMHPGVEEFNDDDFDEDFNRDLGSGRWRRVDRAHAALVLH